MRACLHLVSSRSSVQVGHGSLFAMRKGQRISWRGVGGRGPTEREGSSRSLEGRSRRKCLKYLLTFHSLPVSEYVASVGHQNVVGRKRTISGQLESGAQNLAPIRLSHLAPIPGRVQCLRRSLLLSNLQPRHESLRRSVIMPTRSLYYQFLFV